MEKLLPATRRPDITFKSDGRILIAARVARILNLLPGACINVAVHDGEYLLFAESATLGNHTARCHAVNPTGRYIRANSVVLCRAMLRACHASSSAALMCGQAVEIAGQTYVPIITRTVINK